MNGRRMLVSVLVCWLALAAIPAWGQAVKPRLYTYVSDWTIPRAQWGEFEKTNEASKAALDKLVADGTIVGYGFFYTAAHEPQGSTHGDWIQANSIAGIFKASDALRSTNAMNAALLGSGAHGDLFLVSRNYNGHSGAFNDGILRVISVRVRPGRLEDFRNWYTKNITPVYERLLAEGAIHEYQLVEEWNMTSPQGTVSSVVVAANGEGADKVVAAIADTMEKNPAILDEFGSLTEPGSRHDYLARVTLMRRK